MSAVAHIDEYKTGRFYTDEYRADSSWNGYENNVLLRNEGAADDGILRFTDVGLATGVDDIQDSRGVAIADFDRDGDLDLAINHNPGDAGRPELGQARLYLNEFADQKPWIAFDFEGVSVNRDAIGTVVRLTAGGMTQTRRVEAGSGYASQHGRRVYFGLGDSPRIEGIEIRWPNGDRETIESELQPGQTYRLRQGEAATPQPVHSTLPPSEDTASSDEE